MFVRKTTKGVDRQIAVQANTSMRDFITIALAGWFDLTFLPTTRLDFADRSSVSRYGIEVPFLFTHTLDIWH